MPGGAAEENGRHPGRLGSRAWWTVWTLTLCVAVGVRVWNAFAGPRVRGYDAWAHLAYVFYLDRYHEIPWADQGWSYFHPPVHHLLGWGLLALGGADGLMRGLPLLGGAASLTIAALAALVVQRRWRDPRLTWAAFAFSAFLPVVLNVSPMPGNDMTGAFLAAAMLFVFLGRPAATHGRLRAVAVGVLGGLAFLTKFNLAVPVLALLCVVVLEAWRHRSGRILGRAVLAGLAALLLATPYLLRNQEAYGVPVRLSRQDPAVAALEASQPPGTRGVLDYVRFSPQALSQPEALAPGLVSSVWSSLYANLWWDTHHRWLLPSFVGQEAPPAHPAGRLLACLGLLPTGLVLGGWLLLLRDIRRGDQDSGSTAILATVAAGLSSFVAFTWAAPHWSAVKAAYLLYLLPPAAFGLARAIQALSERKGPAAWVAFGATALAATAGAVVFTAGLVLPRVADGIAVGSVYFCAGEHVAARSFLERRIRRFEAHEEDADVPPSWLENLAAVELVERNSPRAQELYERALRQGVSPERRLRLGAAAALNGRLEGALALLEGDALPELAANRAVVLLASGEHGAAQEALRTALEAEPPPPNARLLAPSREGGGPEPQSPARPFPYVVGTGEISSAAVLPRPLLVYTTKGLRLLLPEAGDLR